MDLFRLFQDHGISPVTEGGTHYRAGWLNIPCPFCTGNPGNHLGFNIEQEYFFCWRCGHKPITKVIETLLGVNWRKAKELIRKYEGKSHNTAKKITIKRKSFVMPYSVTLTESPGGRFYFKKRGFTETDIVTLSEIFSLGITQPGAFVDKMDLSYRVFIPIKYQGDIVSWQTRDMSGKSSLKYIACPEARELIHHKHIFYNDTEDDEVVLCEGVVDVWKVTLAGYTAICGFGVQLTKEQILRLMKIKRVLIFFDPDVAGQSKAALLYKQLLFAGVNAEQVFYFPQYNGQKKDPGDMDVKTIKMLLGDNCKIN